MPSRPSLQRREADGTFTGRMRLCPGCGAPAKVVGESEFGPLLHCSRCMAPLTSDRTKRMAWLTGAVALVCWIGLAGWAVYADHEALALFATLIVGATARELAWPIWRAP